MNYEEARVYLDNVAKYGSVLGLDAMRELLRRLGNPEKGRKIVHIAGTNGKGSVLAFLSTVHRHCFPTGKGSRWMENT